MSTEIVIALIAAAVSLVSAFITLVIGLRSVKVEKQKLENDRVRLKIEASRLQSEKEKLQAETERLRTDADELRRRRLEVEQLELALEKQKGLNLLERRLDIYPEMLELVYRLRNDLRDSLESAERDLERVRAINDVRRWFGPEELGQALYLLTENLYKYRAFIDEETFEMLHRYKRLLQDAKVLLNRSTRPPQSIETKEVEGQEEDFEARWEQESKARLALYEEARECLQEIYQEIDSLYAQITENVKSHIEEILRR
jgi:hypothetical protein